MKRQLLICIIGLWIFCCACSTENNVETLSPLPLNFDQESSLRIEALSAKIKGDAGNPENYYQRARLYLQEENLASAVEDLKESIALKNSVSEYHFLLGFCYQQMGKNALAVSSFKMAEQFGYAEPDLFIGLGQTFMNMHHFKAGMSYIQKGLEYFPRSAKLQVFQGKAYLHFLDTIHALQSFENARSFQPEFYGTYEALFHYYISNQEIYKALEINKLSFDNVSNEDLKFAWIDRAYFYQKNNEQDSAAYYLSLAIAKDSNQVKWLNDLGVLKMNLHDLPNSERYLRRAWALGAHEPQTAYFLGMALHFQGKYEEALTYYQEVPPQHNKYVYAQRFVEKLRYLMSQPKAIPQDTLHESDSVVF